MTLDEKRKIEEDAIEAAQKLRADNRFQAILAYVGMQYDRTKESLVTASLDKVQQAQGEAQAYKRILGLTTRNTQGGRTQAGA